MKKTIFMRMFGFLTVLTMLFGAMGMQLSAEDQTIMVIGSFYANGKEVEESDIQIIRFYFMNAFKELNLAEIVYTSEQNKKGNNNNGLGDGDEDDDAVSLYNDFDDEGERNPYSSAYQDDVSIDKVKQELSFKDSDWSNINKVAGLGKALNVDKVTLGELTKRGATVFLTVKILDVNTKKIIVSHTDKMIDEEGPRYFDDEMSVFCNALVSKAGGRKAFTYVPKVQKPPKMPTPVPYGKYKVGDEGPGGGIVFYASEAGFKVYDGTGGSAVYHYLEMSKKTLGAAYSYPEKKAISTQEGLGYGKSNTYKILNKHTCKKLTNDNCAAYRCSKYSTPTTKPGDWWLPSHDELDWIYKNQKKQVLATCYVAEKRDKAVLEEVKKVIDKVDKALEKGNKDMAKYHWSSTCSDRGAGYLYFGEDKGDATDWWYGAIHTEMTHSVRAVRAF